MGGVVHQAEDEISACAFAIGASYAGKCTVTITSGPGYSLKQEAIGLAVMGEIPLVVVNVQRGGPSTGQPTKVEQGDAMAAIFGSHGDAPKVVMAPATIEECFYSMITARKIAETRITSYNVCYTKLLRSPPAMIDSCAVFARATPPETGASISVNPCAPSVCPSLRVPTGSEELMSITIAPLASAAAAPSSTRTRRTTWPSGSIVISTSAPRITSYNVCYTKLLRLGITVKDRKDGYDWELTA